jgi:hypothetical protein
VKTFNKFLLDENSLSKQTVYMPHETEVVDVVKSDLGVMLIALNQNASAAAPPDLHTFKICASDEIFYVDTVKYIGSYVGKLGLRHVIEIG